MKKKTVVSVMAVAMLFAVSLYFVGGTYARYVDKFTGSAKVAIANWAVEVKNGEDVVSDTFDLQLSPVENEFVVKDKIAPASTAVGTISVDLTGTEVAVDLKVEVTEDSLAAVFGGAKANVKVTVGGKDYDATSADKDGRLIALVDSKAFTGTDAEHGKVDVVISVEWEDDLEGTHDITDTAKGSEGGQVSIPVTLTVQQHIESE